MRAQRIVVAGVLAALTSGGGLGAQDHLAYQLLDKHYNAVGGVEAIKAQETSYTEGVMVLEGTGIAGEFKAWSQRPTLERQEVDLGVLKTVTGDNGTVSWVVDANGRARLLRDTATLERRRIRELRAEFDHLDPESEHFTVTLKGTEQVGGASCFMLETTNSINDDVVVDFINATTYLLEKSETVAAEGTEIVVFSDYRDVDGVMHPFRQEIETLPAGQKTRVEIVSMKTGVNIDAAVFAPPGWEDPGYRFLRGRSAQDIRFELHDNHILVPVSIDGRERLWALDAGEERSTIDAAFAADLRLQTIPTAEDPDGAGPASVGNVMLPGFGVEGVVFDEQPLATSETLAQAWRRRLGVDVAGVLGADFLARFVTRIDYAQRHISLFRPDEFKYAGDGAVMDAAISSGVLAVPAVVDRVYRGMWGLDPGQGDVTLSYRFARENGLLNRKGVDGLSPDASGAGRWRRVRFDSVVLAGLTLANPVVTMPRGDPGAVAAESELVGRLGNSALRQLVLYLDYDRQQVIVERGDHFSILIPHDRSGLELVATGDGAPEVAFVASNTPAARSGFRPGDRLRAVNGIDVRLLDGLGAVRELLRAKPGTTYRITLERDGEQTELTLTLRELL